MGFDAEGLKRRRTDMSLSIEEAAAAAGVAKRQWSDWEKGKQPRHRSVQALAAFFRCEPKALMKSAEHPKLICGNELVKAANLQIVSSAEQFLYITGSRSHDGDYLDAIQDAVTERPNLIHRRLLFGLPEHDVMKIHVKQLLALRNTKSDHKSGTRSLAVTHQSFEPERFPPEACICMNERMALYVLPSIHGIYTYDTAILFEDPQVINGWKHWIDFLILANGNQQLHTGEPLPWEKM